MGIFNKKPGAKKWLFGDGDMPPAGNNPAFEGHEALMITNLTGKKANIKITIIFEDKPAKKGLTLSLEPERIVCVRLDKPAFDQKYKIPSGQYALYLESDRRVCAIFGRLDVRQTNMAYYSVVGAAR